MLKNYFKIAFRNFRRNRVFSFINIFGLATGLTCCIFIAAYVFDELSYDTYPANAKQIYRVELHVTGNGNIETYPRVDVAVGPGMKNAFPEIASYTRLIAGRETFVKYDAKQFKEQKIATADSNFLSFFSIPFLEGDPGSALKEPKSMVVTKAFALKYFGNDDPLGKSLIVGATPFKITGLIDKVPDNSHFHFDAFLSMSSIPPTAQTWSNVGFITYIQLNKAADPQKLESKFPGLVAKYVAPEISHDMGISLAEAQKSVGTFRFFLEPLGKIHLYSDTKYELEANGDIQYIYIFSGLAIFLILLACVNFTNLSTAAAARRAREIGIRKVMGSEKRQLVFQFLIEAILLTYFAVILSAVMVFLLLPYFNQLSGKHLEPNFFLHWKTIGELLLAGLVVGALSGIYPAFFLSSFNTINILKGSSGTASRYKSPLRSGLVIFQFAVSSALIIATLVIYRQLHFMQNKKLGYNKEQVLYLQDTYVLGPKPVQQAFKNELLKDSRVISASVSTDVPGSSDMDGTEIYGQEKQADENNAEIHTNIFHIDYDYIPLLGMQMDKGRNFSKDFPSDSFAVVINQAAVKDLGWSNTDPIGKTIITSGQHAFKVIGVVKDFHYTSLRQKIAPLMMELGSNYRTGLIVKINTADIPGLLSSIKTQWGTFNPGSPFAYYFLDNKFASLYAAEQKTGHIFSLFAIVAILIACLGLLGLTTYITQQRTREIGIRKTFGATVPNICILLSKDFLTLVGISFLVAGPLAWWGMHTWLQHFAYRTGIGWDIFLAAAFLTLAIAIITISVQAIKAAIANPVKSLRSE